MCEMTIRIDIPDDSLFGLLKRCFASPVDCAQVAQNPAPDNAKQPERKCIRKGTGAPSLGKMMGIDKHFEGKWGGEFKDLAWFKHLGWVQVPLDIKAKYLQAKAAWDSKPHGKARRKMIDEMLNGKNC